MRLTLSALVISVGLAGFGLSAQAAPIPASSPLGASVPADIVPVQYGYRREMRRRAIRREVRRDMRAHRRARAERRIIRRLTR
ncbi:hypothetical protein [Enterovirga sp.]|jgi:hypothetical protein|uniref:hypothetical protein n=1 Tax=Enterovirga sp. TaxID=2026350 RepID=UPI00261C44B5|nr:hypothetical protein [Enterovirga sp.]MDB5593012.1 hypothetical protein [Enterovirga sp.]